MNACEMNAAYQRHLLALMEVQPWVSKNTPTVAAALWGCRMQQLSAVSTETAAMSHLPQSVGDSAATTTDTTDNQTQAFAQQTPAQQTQTAEIVTEKTPRESPPPATALKLSSVPSAEFDLARADDGADTLANVSVEAPAPPRTTSAAIAMTTALSEYLGDVAVSAPRLYLHGLRYRHWLLLVDAEAMDTAALGVWQSLEKALDNERYKRMAAGEAVAFMARTLRYPLSDAPIQDRQDYQRLMSLLGFLSRLCQVGDALPSHVGCLTALTGIDLGRYLSGRIQSVPSLQVMAYQNTQKIALWRQLQGD